MRPWNSGDHTIPRFTWYDHRGTTEWVQFDFEQAKEVSSAEVYWYDDTGRGGECRIPKSWQLLYMDGTQWKAVPNAILSEVTTDQWNCIQFEAVETKALRIEAQLQPGYSGGILEWMVK